MTPRTVVLGAFEPGDEVTILEGDRDPEHQRWFEFPGDFVPSLQHACEVLESWLRDDPHGTQVFAVRDAFTNELLGGCELRPASDSSAAISYWTYPRFRGQGVASQALELLRKCALQQLHLDTLEITTDPENIVSQRVATRGGFKRTGTRDNHLLFSRSTSD